MATERGRGRLSKLVRRRRPKVTEQLRVVQAAIGWRALLIAAVKVEPDLGQALSGAATVLE